MKQTLFGGFFYLIFLKICFIFVSMIHTAPKFKKIKLLIKVDNETDSLMTNKLTIIHEDCGMVITGDYIIITEDVGHNTIDEEQSVVGKIYPLSEVDSYKLFKN
jgi:hypothetical protein